MYDHSSVVVDLDIIVRAIACEIENIYNLLVSYLS